MTAEPPSPASPADPSPQHTVLSVLRGAEGWLQQRGHDAPRRTAELLLGKVLGLDRLRLYLSHDRPLDPVERASLRSLVARAGAGEPVAYLLGTAAFRNLMLQVSPAVLIPRPETEELVSLALQHAPPGARVLDLGTGSGAIALALAAERPDLSVTAVDRSEAALAVAAANAAALGLQARVRLVAGSWWSALAADERFAVVVSNPPYIDPLATAGLEPGVAAHEPAAALFTEPGDVLSCYRAILHGLRDRLQPGGWLLAETGVGASGPALALLQAEPMFASVQLLPDLAGIPRYLLARRLLPT